MTSDATYRVLRMNILAMTRHMGIRYEEVGFALAAVGGVLIAVGGSLPLGRRAGSVFGGFGIAVGMVAAIIGLHYGHLG
jgi:hypothetical protein